VIFEKYVPVKHSAIQRLNKLPTARYLMRFVSSFCILSNGLAFRSSFAQHTAPTLPALEPASTAAHRYHYNPHATVNPTYYRAADLYLDFSEPMSQDIPISCRSCDRDYELCRRYRITDDAFDFRPIPRLVPACLHTFCGSCMEDQVQRFPERSSIICPICRKEQVSVLLFALV
jgi:hypothetical protein